MNIEITEKQHRNLLRLRNYFKRVTWACIDQGRPTMTTGRPDPKHPCCFGAHFVGCFREEIWAVVGQRPDDGMHDHRRCYILDRPCYTWAGYFYTLTGVIPSMLRAYGSAHNPFGTEQWAVHPRTVLERILKNVTIK